MKILIPALFILICSITFAQKKQTAKEYQDELYAKYKNPEKSPLKEKAVDFEGLEFFPINNDYRVKAKLIKEDSLVLQKFPTSSGRIRKYKVFGKLKFNIENEDFELTVFQSYPISEEYPNHLFLPFTDNTSGDSTYGGGRYLDLSLKDIKRNKIWLDFNKAYHPYCAYAKGYSCPIPPRENHLETEILAGVSLINQKY